MSTRRISADTGIRREIPGTAFEVPQEITPQVPAESPSVPTPPLARPSPPPAATRAPTGRAGRRVGRTINVDPLMLDILDDAVRRIAVSVGANVQRSACYEAMWVVAIRHLDEVIAIVSADPEGRTIASAFAAELRRSQHITPTQHAPQSRGIP